MLTTSLFRPLGVVVSVTLLSCSLAYASEPQYGDLPLSFEPNRGQASHSVQYLARGTGYGLSLGTNQATLSLSGRGTLAVVHITALRANATQAEGEQRLPGIVNYLRGNDAERWIRQVPTFARVRYRGVYRGVDLIYYGTHRQLEYDFAVAPGADPSQIALKVGGATKVAVMPGGDLLITAGPAEVRWHAPVAYQEAAGVRRPVAAAYEVSGEEVRFRVGEYDRSRELVIDPALVYSSYLGGDGGANGDVGNAIAADTEGNAYIAGYAASANFPVKSGAEQSYNAGVGDAFIAKLNPAGTAFVYSTYLGGGGDDTALGIAVNAQGEAYVTGQTGSGLYGTAPFPTTAAAYQRMPNQATSNNSVFVAKLSADGTELLYSTYISGKSDSSAPGIAVDGSGSAYVIVNTATGFPTTAGAYQRSPGTDQCVYESLADGAAQAVVKLSPDGSRLAYSTYLGHGCDYGAAIAVNAAGEAYITGHTQDSRYPVTAGVKQPTFGGVVDVFVTRLNAAGNGLVYSSFLGGTLAEYGNAIALDGKGYAYISGGTDGDFPMTSGAFQTKFVNNGIRKGFVAKLSPQGKALNFSTYLSGKNDVSLSSVAVDSQYRVYVTGYTTASDYPITSGAVQPTCFSSNGSCMTQAVVTELNAAGTGVVYSSFFGASDGNNQYFPGNLGNAIAVDASGSFYITGRTGGGLRTSSGAVQRSYPATSSSTSAFVAKFSAGSSPQVVIRTPKNGSSMSSPVRVSAVAKDSQPIRVMQVYVDGQKRREVKAEELDVDLAMSTGAHRISVQALDQTGAVYRNSVQVNAD